MDGNPTKLLMPTNPNEELFIMSRNENDFFEK